MVCLDLSISFGQSTPLTAEKMQIDITLDGSSSEDGWNPPSNHTPEGELNHRIGFISISEMLKMYLITLSLSQACLGEAVTMD